MKLKYYLRGVGAGILFAVVILSVSYRVSSKTQLSDAEVIKRAEELGMVKQSDVNMDDLIVPSVTPSADPTATPTVQPADTPSAEPTEAPTATPSAEPTEAPTVTPSPDPSKEPALDPTKKPVKESENSGSTPGVTPEANNELDHKPVSFEIVTGMTSEEVSNLLKKKGIIEDPGAFNQYLKQNDYTTRINIGEFQIEKYASYQDIADAIVGK